MGIFSSHNNSIKTFLTAFFSYRIYANSQKNGSIEKIEEINPKNTIFVFDVHGVIFKLSVFKIIKEVIKDPSNLWIITMMLRPKLCIDLLKSQANGGVAEELIFNVGKNKPHLAWFIPKAFKLINAQVPINSTIKTIQSLKKQGYQLYILSNMGEKSLNYIQKKYFNIFMLFDGVVTATEKDGYIKKPQPEMYQKYLDKFGHDPKKIVFIDDKKQNLIAAEKFGMQTIHFTSSKNLLRKLNKRKAFIHDQF